MRIIKGETTDKPQAPEAEQQVGRLSEIQQNMRSLCAPHYDEFHKTQAAHGFIAITLPKKSRRG